MNCKLYFFVKKSGTVSDIESRRVQQGQLNRWVHGCIREQEKEGNTMKINQNMSAVRANSQLLRTEKKLSVSIERLSSGYKINKPGDNPAGMAISNKMRAQIAALSQAESNVSDGVSVMQIADGALNEVSSILQRMRELTVQAANGTNCLED